VPALTTILWVLGGLVLGYAVWRIGLGSVAALSRPVAPPPPPGELRKVAIRYRCSICGTEIRMTLANDELPDPPRHCQEDMDLVAPIE
jgi:hypothetical protein